MKRIGCLILALVLCLPLLVYADPLDINKADAETIAATMKGVGMSRAAQIIAYRERHGPFKSVEELTSIKGIGDKIIEQNREVITVHNEE